jgi:hypothetical protein
MFHKDAFQHWNIEAFREKIIRQNENDLLKLCVQISQANTQEYALGKSSICAVPKYRIR